MKDKMPDRDPSSDEFRRGDDFIDLMNIDVEPILEPEALETTDFQVNELHMDRIESLNSDNELLLSDTVETTADSLRTDDMFPSMDSEQFGYDTFEDPMIRSDCFMNFVPADSHTAERVAENELLSRSPFDLEEGTTAENRAFEATAQSHDDFMEFVPNENDTAQSVGPCQPVSRSPIDMAGKYVLKGICISSLFKRFDEPGTSKDHQHHFQIKKGELYTFINLTGDEDAASSSSSNAKTGNDQNATAASVSEGMPLPNSNPNSHVFASSSWSNAMSRHNQDTSGASISNNDVFASSSWSNTINGHMDTTAASVSEAMPLLNSELDGVVYDASLMYSNSDDGYVLELEVETCDENPDDETQME